MTDTDRTSSPHGWTLRGYDPFANERYPLGGRYPTEAAAIDAAREYLRELELTQPTSQSGGQSGIQDQVWLVRPDGTTRRVLPDAV